MDELAVDRAALILFRQLPRFVAAYQKLSQTYPPQRPLAAAEASAIGGAVLLFLLYARLCEPGHAVGPEQGIADALAALDAEPEIDGVILGESKRLFDAMLDYKFLREDSSIFDWVAERAWSLCYPGEPQQVPSAFDGYLRALGSTFDRLRSLRLLPPAQPD